MLKNNVENHSVPRLILAATIAIGLLATTAAGATPTSFRFKGHHAEARFDSVNTDGSIRKVTSVSVIDGKSMGSEISGSVAVVSVLINASDVSTGNVLYSISGFVTSLSPDQFTFDPQLRSATLKLTVPATECFIGANINLNVDLVWTATSEPQVTRDMFHKIFPDGSRETIRDFGINRDAVASGTVTDGRENFTPDTGAGLILEAKEGF